MCSVLYSAREFPTTHVCLARLYESPLETWEITKGAGIKYTDVYCIQVSPSVAWGSCRKGVPSLVSVRHCRVLHYWTPRPGASPPPSRTSQNTTYTVPYPLLIATAHGTPPIMAPSTTSALHRQFSPIPYSPAPANRPQRSLSIPSRFPLTSPPSGRASCTTRTLASRLAPSGRFSCPNRLFSRTSRSQSPGGALNAFFTISTHQHVAPFRICERHWKWP